MGLGIARWFLANSHLNFVPWASCLVAADPLVLQYKTFRS